MAERITPVRLNQAMLDSGGDMTLAAVSLGCDENTVKRYIAAEPALKARWTPKTGEAPPETTMTRMPDHQLPEVEAILREESLLRKGIGTPELGLSARQQSLAMGLQKLQRSNYGPLFDVMNGGVVKAALGAQEQLEDNEAALKNIDQLPLEQQLAMQDIIRRDSAALREFIYKAAVKTDQTALVRAKIAGAMSGQKNGHAGGKPGFSPMKRADVTVET